MPEKAFFCCIKDGVFIDPACKSGVFLREIAKRLIKGLEWQFPDLQDRLDHIFHTKENNDCWYTFSKELEPALERTQRIFENKQVYIVSVEDDKYEQGQ